jgi:Glycosyl hydrolase family 71
MHCSYSTHFNYKNWYQRGDDWLINTRWEQVIAMRDKLTFLEILTWYVILSGILVTLTSVFRIQE